MTEANTKGRLRAASAAFRTVMVHAQADPKSTARLETAIHLARDLDATLFGVGAEMIDPVVFSDAYGFAAGLAPEIEVLIHDGLKRAEAEFLRSAADIRTQWVALEEEPARALSLASRGADIIVTDGHRHPPQTAYSGCDAGELILKSGRPVLVTPHKGGRLNAEAVVVAWKDTRESRRALADSLPFLKDAADVLVLEVCKVDEAEMAEAQTAAVVAGLRRHGVEARAKVKFASPEVVAEQIEIMAENIGADLIVAGGYGHSRLGEWVLGGVTRALLRQPRRFVLLSH